MEEDREGDAKYRKWSGLEQFGLEQLGVTQGN